MYWLIETEEQLKCFDSLNVREAFVEVIPYSNTEHPCQNHACSVYVRPLNDTKGYIFTIDHSEALKLSITEVIRVLHRLDKLYVRDKKEFLHYFPFKKTIDLTPTQHYQIKYTPAHYFFYRKYNGKFDVNKIVPIVKHYEYCEQIYNDLKDNFNNETNEFYNTKATVVFHALEKSGIHIDQEKFTTNFHKVDSEFVFSQYNFKTLTTRPSNKFKGVNYAALNKENGEREAIIPRNHRLIEIDISAYHPIILANLIGYEFGDKNVHQAFANMYEVDYKKAKELTFRQLYGGIFKEYKHLEFFQKTQTYIDYIWGEFTTKGYYQCPVSDHKFFQSNLQDMKPQKLLNYVLQNLETAIHINILWEVFRLLKGKETKIVLYVFDAIILDIHKDEKELISQIVEIYNNYKLDVKIKGGKNYHSMVGITMN